MQYHIYDIIHMILHLIYYDVEVIYYDIIEIYDFIVAQGSSSRCPIMMQYRTRYRVQYRNITISGHHEPISDFGKVPDVPCHPCQILQIVVYVILVN